LSSQVELRKSADVKETILKGGTFGGTIIDGTAEVVRKRQVSDLNLIEATYSSCSKVPAHAHERALFCIVLNGNLEATHASKVRPFQALSVEFLPPNQSHALFFSATTHAFCVDIPPQWLETAKKYLLKLDNYAFASGALSWLLRRLYKEFLTLDAASSLAIEGLTLEMLAEVSRLNVTSVNRNPPRWISQVVSLVRARYSDRLTLAEIAAAVSVHPVHLAREFRRFQGCTIGEYVRQLRIEQACRELSDSNQSLATIAAGAGFADQSHFSKTFKRLVGMTPVQYRSTVAAR
jgi:AraC family transcriptional regulator